MIWTFTENSGSALHSSLSRNIGSCLAQGQRLQRPDFQQAHCSANKRIGKRPGQLVHHVELPIRKPQGSVHGARGFRAPVRYSWQPRGHFQRRQALPFRSAGPAESACGSEGCAQLGIRIEELNSRWIFQPLGASRHGDASYGERKGKWSSAYIAFEQNDIIFIQLPHAEPVSHHQRGTGEVLLRDIELSGRSGRLGHLR